MTQEEYARMLDVAKDGFKSDKPLFGKDGAFHRFSCHLQRYRH